MAAASQLCPIAIERWIDHRHHRLYVETTTQKVVDATCHDLRLSQGTTVLDDEGVEMATVA